MISIERLPIYGRVLYATKNYVYFGRLNKCFKLLVNGTDRDCMYLGHYPVGNLRKMTGFTRLGARLLRYEPRAFATIEDNTQVVASKEYVFVSTNGKSFAPITIEGRDNRGVYPPITISTDGERFFWGEYWANPCREPITMFYSYDGKTFIPFYTFKGKEVRHIHQIVPDSYEKCLWVFTGDFGSEAGIARVDWDLKQLEWVVRGKQVYRAVTAFVFEDKIVYGTDTEKEQNYVCIMDKSTLKISKVCALPGSCIYGTQTPSYMVLSTTVESSKYINNFATLWISKDGIVWEKIFEVPKDIWPKKLFQYGSIVLPRGKLDVNVLCFSGQALKGWDGRIGVIRFKDEG